MRPKQTLTVFNSSKAEFGEVLTDYFEVIGTKRNGRVKILCTTNNVEYWVSAEELEAENTKLFEEIIEHPIIEEIVEPTITITAIPEEPKTVKQSLTHTVKRGENISTIAKKYNVSESQLRAINGTYNFSIGQVIRIS